MLSQLFFTFQFSLLILLPKPGAQQETQAPLPELISLEQPMQWILFLILLLFLVFSFTCPINESFSIFDKIKSFGDKARDDLEGSFKTIKKESENTFDLIKNNVNNISDQIKSGDIDPILKLRSFHESQSSYDHQHYSQHHHGGEHARHARPGSQRSGGDARTHD